MTQEGERKFHAGWSEGYEKVEAGTKAKCLSCLRFLKNTNFQHLLMHRLVKLMRFRFIYQNIIPFSTICLRNMTAKDKSTSSISNLSLNGSNSQNVSAAKKNEIKSVSKKRTASQGPIEIKSIPVQEKNRIDTLVGRFFFGCNIPFSVIDSSHFKSMISALNPYYKTPHSNTLKSTILENSFHEMTIENTSSVEAPGILMLDGYKNKANNRKNVTAIVKQIGKKEFVLKSYDATNIPETGDFISNIIVQASESSLNQHNIKIYAVCTDNANNMRMGTRNVNLLDYGCKAHLGNLFLGDVVKKELVNLVRRIVVAFRKPNLQEQICLLGGTKLMLAGLTR